MGASAQRWADELAAWRIDDEILAAAPESPYSFPPELFRADGPPPDSPSARRAREALPPGGSVLDVGCGGGAASLALVPPAARVTGVDQSREMLAQLAASAAERGVAHAEVEGRWPDVAGSVDAHDVVVCHHVLYNVADVVPFARALSAHARRRVVVELTAVHPWVPIGPLWRHFHGQDRPEGPSAELAAAVLREDGLDVHEERFTRPARGGVDRQVLVGFARRRLCLPIDREPEVDALLTDPETLHVTAAATLWWDVQPD